MTEGAPLEWSSSLPRVGSDGAAWVLATSETQASQGWGDSPRQTRSRHAEEAPPNPAALDRCALKLRFPPHAARDGSAQAKSGNGTKTCPRNALRTKATPGLFVRLIHVAPACGNIPPVPPSDGSRRERYGGTSGWERFAPLLGRAVVALGSPQTDRAREPETPRPEANAPLYLKHRGVRASGLRPLPHEPEAHDRWVPLLARSAVCRDHERRYGFPAGYTPST